MPLGLGGLPAPSFQPRLNGRNQDAFPLRWVQKRTSLSSTAKWATQRPNSNSFSRGLRSSLVLPHRIVNGLLGEVVLQLEREDRQAVDEEPDVERPLRLVAAVAKLPDDGEAVLLEALLRLHVPGRRRAVEQVQVVRAVSDAVAQHVDGAALGDLALQPGEELAPRRTVLVERQRFGGVRLGGLQECRELDPIDAELAVVVVGIAAAPARAAVAGAGLRCPALLRRIAGMAG